MAGNKKSPPEDNAGQAASSEGPEHAFKNRLEKYHTLKQTQTQISIEIPNLIEKFNNKQQLWIGKKWENLCGCGNWMLFRHYYTKDEYRLKDARFCRQHMICPLCGAIRSTKATREVATKVEQIMADDPELLVTHLVITIKHRPGLQQCKDHLSMSFKRLNARRKNGNEGLCKSEFAKVMGGVYSWEVEEGNDELWHVHIHGLVLHKEDFAWEWNQEENHGKGQWVPAELRREWKRITGDSHYVTAYRVGMDEESFIHAVCEVTSYSLKFSKLKTEDLLKAAWVFKGSKLLRFNGLLYCLKIPDEVDQLVEEDLHYLDLFYRYGERKGYFLEKSEKGVQTAKEAREHNQEVMMVERENSKTRDKRHDLIQAARDYFDKRKSRESGVTRG